MGRRSTLNRVRYIVYYISKVPNKNTGAIITAKSSDEGDNQCGVMRR